MSLFLKNSKNKCILFSFFFFFFFWGEGVCKGLFSIFIFTGSVMLLLLFFCWGVGG